VVIRRDKISVKNVYVAMEKKKWNFVIGGWRKSMWSWDCPLKIKLFTWLVAENKILTGKFYNTEVLLARVIVSYARRVKKQHIICL
jgi:hypothetical protein